MAPTITRGVTRHLTPMVTSPTGHRQWRQ
jgi:hypothetical protein